MDSCGIVLVIMAVAFGAGLLLMFTENEAKAKALRSAEATYRSSLASLKASPTNADLKEETLRRGRIYSNLTRNRKGVTLYDEVALLNDINAACARAGVPEMPAVSSTKTIEDRLAQLKQLREKALITDQEYESRRAELIKEV